tara:strand:+ start:1452 stop:1700 length:249 start_codon:yes stop_codon:yes gene_type:complete
MFAHMKAPQIPSFFKSSSAKKFNFQARYYNETKERIENLKNKEDINIKFKRKVRNKNKTNRLIRIIFLVVFLYIIAYKYLIN